MGPTFDKCHSNHHYLEPRYEQRCESHIRCLHKALIQSVALVFEIEERDLEAATRGKAPIARARQVAMYIARIGLCMSLTDVGRLFGRDRTTVAHACEAIEDLRDDPSFDRRLELLEKGLNALTAARALPSRRAVGDVHAHARD